MQRKTYFIILILLILTGIFTLFSPLERTLGTKARLVYFHGAWVWAGMLGFIIAGGTGLIGVITQNNRFHTLSRSWGRTALLFWLIFLPMSLLVMQANWNGLFLDEPRFRLPLNLAIVGVILQTGLSLLPLQYTSIGNLLYALVFFWVMGDINAVLHPESPVFQSGSITIKIFFGILVILLLLLAWQVSIFFRGTGQKLKTEDSN